MKRSQKPPTLHVKNDENLEEFLKEARRVWRGAHPDLALAPGRPSQRQDDHRTIDNIAKASAGFSGPSVTIWTQNSWVAKVGESRGQLAPGSATIKKHLKSYLNKTPLPIQMIPASIIQNKPLDEQLRHWFCIAIAEAMVSDCRPKPDGLVHLPRERLNVIHRKLCQKHILQSKRRSKISEPKRQAWFDRQWGRTRAVPVESR